VTTLTTAETLVVDGVALNTMAFNIKTYEGRVNVPARKGDLIEAVADHGSIAVTDRPFQTGRQILGMWILGCDEDGNVPTTYRVEFEKNRQKLIRLFARGKLMTLQQTRPDGTVLQCQGIVTDAIDISTMAGATRAEFNVGIDIPRVFWEDTATSAADSGASITLPKTLTLTGLVNASAPTSDIVTTVTGPITNPVITQPDNGWTASLNVAVPSGQTWVVDANLFTTKLNAVNNLQNFTHTGGARFMEIPSKTDGTAPTLVLSGSGASAATRFQATVRRKML
jgi:hypothetical protein